MGEKWGRRKERQRARMRKRRPRMMRRGKEDGVIFIKYFIRKSFHKSHVTKEVITVRTVRKPAS